MGQHRTAFLVLLLVFCTGLGMWALSSGPRAEPGAAPTPTGSEPSGGSNVAALDQVAEPDRPVLDSSREEIERETPPGSVEPVAAFLPVTVAVPSGDVPTDAVLVVRDLTGPDAPSRHARRRVIPWTHPRQQLQLEPGAHRIEAYAGLESDPAREPIDAARRSWAQEVTLQPGENEPVTLMLLWSGGIQGEVSGSLLDDPVVLIERLEEGETVDGAEILTSNKRDESSGTRLFEVALSGNSATVTEGRFAELGLAPSRYLLKVGTRSGAVYAYEVVDVARTVVEVSFDLEPPAERRLSVEVIGAGGDPLSQGTSFNLVRSRGGEVEIAEGVILGVEKGVHEVVFPTESFEFFDPRAAGARYTLVAARDAEGEQRAELAPGQLQASVTFATPVWILAQTEGDVKLDGELQEAARGRLLVRAIPLADIASGARVTAIFNKPFLVEDERDAAIKNLAPGRYLVTLNLVKRGGWPWTDEIQLDGALVEAFDAESSVALRIPALHGVRLLVPDRPEGTAVSLANIGQIDEMSWGPFSRIVATLGSDGRCTLPEVPAGAYSVTVEGVPGAMRLEVPCGEVEFTPDR